MTNFSRSDRIDLRKAWRRFCTDRDADPDLLLTRIMIHFMDAVREQEWWRWQLARAGFQDQTRRRYEYMAGGFKGRKKAGEGGTATAPPPETPPATVDGAAAGMTTVPAFNFAFPGADANAAPPSGLDSNAQVQQLLQQGMEPQVAALAEQTLAKVTGNGTALGDPEIFVARVNQRIDSLEKKFDGLVKLVERTENGIKEGQLQLANLVMSANKDIATNLAQALSYIDQQLTKFKDELLSGDDDEPAAPAPQAQQFGGTPQSAVIQQQFQQPQQNLSVLPTPPASGPPTWCAPNTKWENVAVIARQINNGLQQVGQFALQGILQQTNQAMQVTGVHNPNAFIDFFGWKNPNDPSVLIAVPPQLVEQKLAERRPKFAQ